MEEGSAVHTILLWLAGYLIGLVVVLALVLPFTLSAKRADARAEQLLLEMSPWPEEPPAPSWVPASPPRRDPVDPAVRAA